MYTGSERSTATRTKDEAQTQIQSLKQQIDGGADFGDLAKQHSDCPSGERGAMILVVMAYVGTQWVSFDTTRKGNSIAEQAVLCARRCAAK